MNNLFKIAPLVGSVKNAMKFNNLQHMSFCSDEKPKFEKSEYLFFEVRTCTHCLEPNNKKELMLSFNFSIKHCNFVGESWLIATSTR